MQFQKNLHIFAANKNIKTMKKLKFLVGAVALFALAVVNVWNAATTLRGSDLSLADVEAMATPEGMDDVGGYKYHGRKSPRDCIVKVKILVYDCGARVDEGSSHCCIPWPRMTSKTTPTCHVRYTDSEDRPGKERVCLSDETQYCRPVECHEVGPFGF